MKANEVMIVDLSDEDIDDENIVLLGGENATLESNAQKSSDEMEEEEGNSEGQSIPLIGSRLGVVSIGEEENEEFTRVRGQATPWRLFDSSSQPSPSDLRQESRSSLLSPSLLPNPSRSQRGKCPVDSDDRRRQRVLDDEDTSMIIALQALVSKFQNPPTNNMNLIMLNMLQKIQEN
jgi:hypothetical protein